MDTAEKTNILGLIPARGGSKSITRKNMAEVGGRRLLEWSVEAALNCPELDTVCVSSDDEQMTSFARQLGAEAPFLRPVDLASDTADTASAAIHALDWFKANRATTFTHVCLLQPTSPFRLVSDISETVKCALMNDAAVAMTVTESHQNPYLMRQMDAEGRMTPFMQSSVKHPRRQDLPPAYFINGAVYVAESHFLRENETFYPEVPYGHIMPEDRSLQIDTPWDLKLADVIARKFFPGRCCKPQNE